MGYIQIDGKQDRADARDSWSHVDENLCPRHVLQKRDRVSAALLFAGGLHTGEPFILKFPLAARYEPLLRHYSCASNNCGRFVSLRLLEARKAKVWLVARSSS